MSPPASPPLLMAEWYLPFLSLGPDPASQVKRSGTTVLGVLNLIDGVNDASCCTLHFSVAQSLSLCTLSLALVAPCVSHT